MDLKEINLIRDIITKIKKERQALEKKKGEMQKRFDTRMAKNKASIDELSNAERKVEAFMYFNREKIMPIITYLVSLIEEKEYYYVEKVLPIKWDYEMLTNEYDYRNTNDELKLRICYLCQDKKKAEEEINYHLGLLQRREYAGRYVVLKKFLLLPKDNYIQICVYNRHFGNSSLKFVDNIGIKEVYYSDYQICYEETTTKYKNYLNNYESHIRDERFIYIIYFMDYLSGKRYESNHELSNEEMKAYAEEFAREYKKYDVMKRIRDRQNSD